MRDDRASFKPAIEFRRQITSGVITQLRFALQRFGADRFQVAIEGRRESAQFRGRSFGCLLNHVERVLAQKRRPACQQIKENSAETVNIGSRRKRRARTFGLLGRNIAGGAEDGQSSRQVSRCVEPLGQTKVTHQRVAAAHRAGRCPV